MAKLRAFILLLLCALCGAGSAFGKEAAVAKVIDREITAREINYVPGQLISCDEISCTSDSPVKKLMTLVNRRVMEDYKKKNSLYATDAEIRRFGEHQKEFMRLDRQRRKTELADIEKKLSAGGLNDQQRQELEEYRTTLLTLAGYDEEESGGESMEIMREVNAPWIETWKVFKSLYEKYGGAVDDNKFGPVPVGAIKALFEEYRKQGALVVYDKELDKAFWELVSQPPRIPAQPGKVDFTPFWEKPVPEEAEGAGGSALP